MKVSCATHLIVAALLVFGFSKYSPALAAPDCGVDLPVAYRGVAPKSNGKFQGTGTSCEGTGTYGLLYQCVEFVRRFYSEGLGVDTTKWPRVNHASDFFSIASNPTMRLLAFRNGSRFAPRADDIIVFNGGSDGHVAIIASVSINSASPQPCENVGDCSVTIIEQNWSDTGRVILNLTRGTDGSYTVRRPGSLYRVSGWLRKPYSFRIDNFKIIRNNALFYEDTFGDGVPPPGAPNFPSGSAASYSVTATLGPETAGKLTFDSSFATIVGSIPPGDNFFFQRARLQTNTDSSNLTLGLKIDDTFSVTGIFDLTVPIQQRIVGYGISLTDRTSTSAGDDGIRLLVRRVGSNLATVDFLQLDPTAGTFTTLGSISLEPSHHQIALTLFRITTANNRIFAHVAYLDSGIEVISRGFATFGEIFRNENFTRAGFFAESALPSP